MDANVVSAFEDMEINVLESHFYHSGVCLASFHLHSLRCLAAVKTYSCVAKFCNVEIWFECFCQPPTAVSPLNTCAHSHACTVDVSPFFDFEEATTARPEVTVVLVKKRLFSASTGACSSCVYVCVLDRQRMPDWTLLIFCRRFPLVGLCLVICHNPVSACTYRAAACAVPFYS